MKWGLERKDEAREDYLSLMNKFGKVTVEPAELTLLSSHSFLGYASDGIVRDCSLNESVQKDDLEIKCPFSLDKSKT